VVGVAAEGLRDDLFEPRLDVVDRLPRREARAVADAKDMRVDRESLHPERGVEHDIRGLAADAGQRLQLFARSGHLAVMAVDQRLTERDDVFRLGVEQADGFDRVAQGVFPKGDHLSRRLDVFEERAASNVDAGVGRLGGQDHRDQQLVRIARFELGRRGRIRFGEPAEELEHLVALHWRSSSALPSLPSASSKSPVGRPKPTRK